MDKEHLEEIINSYKWIKVKKYEELDIDNKEYQELLAHHKKETEFLINKCKELAKLLLNG